MNMEMTIAQLQAKLLREYYKGFSKFAKGKQPERKIAWVTSFAPVEILSALDIDYYYPESYAAVIAASGQEQALLKEAGRVGLSADCCAYSCCFEGSVSLEKGPRGVPPKPDILIASNNQCNTLPGWWNILAQRYDVPLIVTDYPGEGGNEEETRHYVKWQHERLIAQLEQLTERRMDRERLNRALDQSQISVKAWENVLQYMPDREAGGINLFDAMSYLILARCREETAVLYQKMAEELSCAAPANRESIQLFWLGYPLWYHPDRILSEVLDGCRVCGANYVSWWNLDYSGEDIFERLFRAYNYTFLNLKGSTRTEKLTELLQASRAQGVITLHNKSCKCDFVSARNIGLPQAELEIDMVDRTFLDVEGAKRKVQLLKQTICTG